MEKDDDMNIDTDFFKTTIGDQITLQRGFDITKKQQVNGDIPVVSSGGISSFHNKSKVDGPGVVLGRKGSLGTVFFINQPFWPHDTSLWVKDFKRNNPRFVYYFFKSISEKLKGMDVGAANPALNRNHVHPMEVTWAIKKRQDDIVQSIGALDDKISLNTQTNQNLEAMAQAIFKSWFVDFDPVKAKMNGEQPEGMDEATASLFPEKLVESSLGLIPEGWEVKPFSEWVNITKGKNITKKTIVKGDVPVVAGGLKPAYFHNAHNVNGPAITISASGANAGYVNLYFENIWASDCSYISQSTAPLFFLQYVALKSNQKKIFDMQTGAAQPHIYPRDFERLMIVVPNERLCRKLEEVFASFFEIVANNKQQNIELAALRDTLLPRFLSGEIALEENRR